jgi:hypothetical protein
MAAIWLRGLVLRRQITDREYRLALRAAANKSASRSLRNLRTYTYTPILNGIVLFPRDPATPATSHSELQETTRSHQTHCHHGPRSVCYVLYAVCLPPFTTSRAAAASSPPAGIWCLLGAGCVRVSFPAARGCATGDETTDVDVGADSHQPPPQHQQVLGNCMPPSVFRGGGEGLRTHSKSRIGL